MQEFRKTATIRAVQWWQHGDHPAVVLKIDRHRYADEGVPWIETFEGGHIVTPGDWIATGIQGEHWPIKPDIFAATYEPVTSPTTNPVVVSETPVGDHQMVDAVDRVLIEAIINDYHTTRLDRDYVPHILSKPRTVEAFARHRQAALTAARAQVEGESQRLREALEQCRAQFAFYADEHRKADKSEKAATNERFAQIARQSLAAGEHRKDG